MERLELSQHMLLGPKSSASTNSATSVKSQKNSKEGDLKSKEE